MTKKHGLWRVALEKVLEAVLTVFISKKTKTFYPLTFVH